MWKAWKSLFSQCVDKHAPLRPKRVRAMKSTWITPHLKKMRMNARKGRTIRKVMGGRGIFELQEFFFVIKFFA